MPKRGSGAAPVFAGGTAASFSGNGKSPGAPSSALARGLAVYGVVPICNPFCQALPHHPHKENPPENSSGQGSGTNLKKYISPIALISLLVLTVLIPCRGGAAAGDGQPAYGDTIVYGMLGEPSNLLPYLSSDTSSSEVAGQFYVAPLKYDKDLNVVKWAAETFDILDDGLKLRFTLKKGIRWQDGTELTADDAEFTYLTMINPETPTAYAGDFKVITAFRKLDRYSFEVEY